MKIVEKLLVKNVKNVKYVKKKSYLCSIKTNGSITKTQTTMTIMKYYIKINEKIEQTDQKTWWSLARNKKNKIDIYYEKGRKKTRVLKILA